MKLPLLIITLTVFITAVQMNHPVIAEKRVVALSEVLFR
jgi:hypothetical protein